ncbi:hypothetical protein QJ856_gp0184 [Tupanvirus deep ocean]|uniref:Uncharacterized protein n=2 Tax=Tupanvirus TaxID=2094720 RepID=A0AC62A9U9_9VIRU|nr:hypothetical protein QJ856_gp0184 [Tupanvirus deep ocean]QKU34544.1 hypothetical protein [Tupanvirus deep ocean]
MSTLSSSYVQCATENGSCNATGKQAVAYTTGTGRGSIYYRNMSGNISCNNNTFGDPSRGDTKNCYLAPIPADVLAASTADVLAAATGFYDSNGNPVGWTQCATENNICNPGTGNPVDILYGAKSSYVYANASSTPCDNTTFGDPSVGNGKACYWRLPLTPAGPSIPGPVAPGYQPSPSAPPIPRSTNTMLYIGIAIAVLLVLAIIIFIIIRSRHKNSE